MKLTDPRLQGSIGLTIRLSWAKHKVGTKAYRGQWLVLTSLVASCCYWVAALITLRCGTSNLWDFRLAKEKEIEARKNIPRAENALKFTIIFWMSSQAPLCRKGKMFIAVDSVIHRRGKGMDSQNAKEYRARFSGWNVIVRFRFRRWARRYLKSCNGFQSWRVIIDVLRFGRDLQLCYECLVMLSWHTDRKREKRTVCLLACTALFFSKMETLSLSRIEGKVFFCRKKWSLFPSDKKNSERKRKGGRCSFGNELNFDVISLGKGCRIFPE